MCLHEVSSAEISAWLISSAPPSTPQQRYSSATQRRAVPCPAMPCSSAQQRTAAAALAQQSAALCFAVLCRALPCCVLCCVFTSSYMPVTFEASYHVPVLLILCATPGLYILRRCWITNNAPPAQVSPAMYSSAAQRSAVRCRALPFVLRCCVVRRCAFF